VVTPLKTAAYTRKSKDQLWAGNEGALRLVPAGTGAGHHRQLSNAKKASLAEGELE
jgi:hypothetical protein